ncbi:hypothetical protein [Nesterenkonia pannonica]|uniref:hypothetical protein n=1 Tax=Nesterenkonia pannonica TaxID=1548602 RepID=UPI0021645BD9|nr:hypothetical protein [Nesterenkonia pannonica]
MSSRKPSSAKKKPSSARRKPTRSPRPSTGSSGARRRSPESAAARQRRLEQQQRQERRWTWARRLWGAVTSLLIAALLFESTMIFTLGMGVYMLSVPEFIGLWFVVSGYVLACLPWAFGLLIATGQFWRSLTHALWIGLIYGTVGFLFLDQILAAF